MATASRGECIDTRMYPSTRRGSTEKYYVKKWADGSLTCGCPGWRFWRDKSQPRSCTHLNWYALNYWLITTGEATRKALDGIQWRQINSYPGLMLVQYAISVAQPGPVIPRDMYALSDSEARKREQAQRGGMSFQQKMEQYKNERLSQATSVLTIEEMRLAEEGRVIAAVKMIRERTGAMLSEAKRMVDDYLRVKGYLPSRDTVVMLQGDPIIGGVKLTPEPKPLTRARIVFDEEV